MCRRIVLLLGILAFLSGCSRDRDAEPSAVPASDSVATSLQSPTRSGSALPRTRAATFAGLPDTGNLVAYPSGLVRRDGAYTWHRTSLSEQHALRSISDGRLTVTAPSGETLDFSYARHVEHPSGDWTWVGKLEGAAEGEEAILTFGEKAAFGSIAQHGKEPLRLTIRDGVSWLVETDRIALAAINNTATRPRGPDFFIPPKLATRQSSGASDPSMTGAAASTAAAVAAGGNTVDLVLGYTTGFAAGLGGQSQAMTRLNFLVDVTNQSYVNSQVNAQVRLVHALQVNYPDATSNDSALEEMTGFSAPSTRTTPAEAFSALRAARDQYGGDLVSLVRKFNDPENEGCGIAWLIGGGRTGIDQSDEYFGYSVVSDGRDAGNDGKTYFCRDETLAHELGHNMGSQHDRTAATVNGTLQYGVYPYSFGYKTDATQGDFYTVMAYGDAGQLRYRVFSNPRTTYCGGFACGVADDADNARSLTQTIPTIASFRASIVPPAPARTVAMDLDADGKSDLFWYNGEIAAWWNMNGATIASSGGQSPGTGVQFVTMGDLNGDGRADAVLRMPNNLLILWRSVAGGGFIAEGLGFLPGGWTLVEARDVDADGKDDLLWYNGSSFVWWYMNGATPSGSGGQATGYGHQFLASADFNGDKRVDVLWRRADGNLEMWIGNGAGFAVSPIGGYPQGWSLAAAGDIDGNGTADLAWLHADGTVAWWFMSGTSIVSTNGQSLGARGHRLLASGDYDGDGRLDFIWRTPDGNMRLWTYGGTDFTSLTIGNYPVNWSLLPIKATPGDMDGDGRADVLWSNGSMLAWWNMAGPQIAASGGQPFGSGFVSLGIDDFDGDGLSDVMWRDGGYSLNYWQSRGYGFLNQMGPMYQPSWVPLGAGDITGDGRADLLWNADGVLRWWAMSGALTIGNGGQAIPAGSTLLARLDADGDGRAALLWRTAVGQLELWRYNGTAFSVAPLGSIPANQTFVTAIDMDGDGRDDLVWQGASTVFWSNLQAGATVRVGSKESGFGYDLVAAGDFDGDGREDLLWNNLAKQLELWTSTGSGFTVQVLGGYPDGWVPLRWSGGVE